MRACAHPVVAALASACGLAVAVSPALGQSGVLHEAAQRVFPDGRGPVGSGGPDAAGPDVIVGELMARDFGANQTPPLLLDMTSSSSGLMGSTATHIAYGIGTTSCNIGTVNLEWIGSCNATGSNRKPVIPQNMYRLSTVNGVTRFEQVGQSWLKHAFTALQQNACAMGCAGPGGSVLGIGCSDPYTASRNASQNNPSGANGGTGPRYQVNPYTGDYPWPLGTLPALTDGTSRRVRVLRTDLQVTSATTATQYFAEALYVTRDDARHRNNGNNSSYRRMFCTDAATGAMRLEGDGTYNNGTHREVPAIFAWRDFGKIAENPGNPMDTSVMIREVSTGGAHLPPDMVPTGDGSHFIASRATQLPSGAWHYEYAVYNYNSDRMGGSFTVPLPTGATVSNVEWKGVDSHSGVAAEDATRNAPWVISVSASSVAFSAPAPYTGHDYMAHPITAIATGSPATVTSPGHGLATGDTVLIRGTDARVSGLACANLGYTTGANGAYPVTVIDADTFTIPMPAGATLDVAGTMGTWGSPSTLGNGIRWGTLYNFRFDSNAAPSTAGQVTLGFFKRDMPGFPNEVIGSAWVPKVVPPPCYANCDSSTTAPVLNVADFGCFLTKYAAGCP